MSDAAISQASDATTPNRRELANAIRALSMDAVQAANSGHPGAPMGMADIAEVLWRDYLSHNPNDPAWVNRDRFVLSNGHGSMLIYALLHLTGYDLPIEEIRNFRQLNAMTAGHPEYGHAPGIETTTGPLGQGLANAVGMALAERNLAAEFNRDDFNIVDHYTYTFVGDGCLMEGISHEACSLAGTLKLGKLIVIYDDNNISIDGKVDGWFSDDTKARFEAYGWQVVGDVDGHDATAVAAAIAQARDNSSQPSLICCKTLIGYGSPNKQGTADCHGAALGDDEVQASREALGWSSPPFEIPNAVAEQWDARAAGTAVQATWDKKFASYRAAHPELAAEFDRRVRGTLPSNWERIQDEALQQMHAEGAKQATRKASQQSLELLAPHLPELIGGSADLTGSNNTNWSGSKALSDKAEAGNYVYYGVREFAMSAMMNGLALHGGYVPYGGTFLVFSDYARNAIRMSALMGLGAIYVYTHDSIGLGEDGPTHQPIEHAASLRLIPNASVWRPCDGSETLAAWNAAISRRDGPSCLLLTRQGLPMQQRDAQQLTNIARGGYVLIEPATEVNALIIATGSEVELAVHAAKQLNSEGAGIRVVSMPNCEMFEAQDASYRDSVIPPTLRQRIVIEAGATAAWYRYAGLDGCVIGLDEFGASAPAADLFEHFELTPEHVTRRVAEYLAR